MRRLVALDLPGGPEFVQALGDCIESNEAVAPLDQRLVGSARDRIVEALRPTDLIDRFGERHRLRDGLPVEDGDLVVVATSGTTGDPKGVILTDDAVASSASASSRHLGVDPQSDHWFCALPLNHVGGLSVVLRALYTGTRLSVVERFSVEAAEEALDRGATLTSLVPTTLRRLGQRADGFRKILLGGSAPPDRLPDNVVTTYGMTESGSGVVYDGWPLEGVDVEVRPDGEIALAAPMLLRAYRDGRDPKDERGFYRTGDIGRIGADGRLEVFGRTSELIISGGENIWPAALERALAGAEGVAEIAVCGLADPEWGERAVAIAVPSGTGPALPRLNDILRSAIGPFATLKALALVEALPKTAIGKVDRRAIAALAQRQFGRDLDPLSA